MRWPLSASVLLTMIFLINFGTNLGLLTHLGYTIPALVMA